MTDVESLSLSFIPRGGSNVDATSKADEAVSIVVGDEDRDEDKDVDSREEENDDDEEDEDNNEDEEDEDNNEDEEDEDNNEDEEDENNNEDEEDEDNNEGDPLNNDTLGGAWIPKYFENHGGNEE